MRRRRAVLLTSSAFLILSLVNAMAADWSPEKAAGYLDARQKEWFAWKPAQSANGPCVSCHTGLPYLMARPMLRRTLGEAEPTRYERGLRDRLRAHVGAKPRSPLQDIEVIFAALFLAEEDAGRAMSPDTRKAFDQLWSLQRADGPGAGGWGWYSANLDPWENPGSGLFGAALAALAVGMAPDEVRSQPFDDRVKALAAYLRAPGTQSPSLHDRLAVLWASSVFPQAMDDGARSALIAATLERQSADGGWTIESLGPWAAHAGAPPARGSNSYATAFVAYVLQRAGVAASDPRLRRALDWLVAHQDASSGAWPALSMNKTYPAGSMESMFMQDAATSLAAMALIEARR